MSRRCAITGAKPALGHRINRSGKAKKKGGIGTHITSTTRRTFVPNLKSKRIWVPELRRFVTVKVSVRGLKAMTKNGVYATLKASGAV